jgi:mitochondrial intermembrane space import and assembly protein 40
MLLLPLEDVASSPTRNEPFFLFAIFHTCDAMSFGYKKDGKDEIYVLTREDTQVEKEEAPATEQSAFDPITRQINWECPCLGDLPRGPCGDQFKSAFSCFVFSEQEPKGVDCIDAFAQMKLCFSQFPEYYADQLADDTPNTIQTTKDQTENEEESK